MKRTLLLGITTLALVAAGCASQSQPAEQASEEPVPVIAANESDPDAVIRMKPSGDDVRCRRVAVTGTHFRRTVCTSAKQRAQMQDQAAEHMERESRVPVEAPKGY